MRRRTPRAVLTVLGAVLVAVFVASQAVAAPPPPNPSDSALSGAAAKKQAAAAAVGTVAAELAQVGKQLAMLEAQTEAAADAHLQAEGQVEVATTKATDAAQQLTTATATLGEAEAAVQNLARNSYMQGSFALSDITLLDASGPADLIERSNMLQIATTIQVGTMADLQLAKIAQSNADSAARNALQQKQQAETKAKAALDLVTTKLANAEAAAASLKQKQTSLAAQLRKAQQYAAGLAGQRATYDKYVADEAAKKAAAAAAAQAKAAASAAAAAAAAAAAPAPAANPPSGGSGGAGSAAPPPASGPAPAPGGWAIPAGGYLSSCFCARWGTFHYGIDIAAPMYTPVYAAGPGTVIRAGSATGFGQAIYIQHDDGSVTVYGHIETIFVSAGQRVAGGQHIAGIGTRGFSTGPHLHFEVTMGMYGTRVNPIPYLAARGVYL